MRQRKFLAQFLLSACGMLFALSACALPDSFNESSHTQPTVTPILPLNRGFTNGRPTPTPIASFLLVNNSVKNDDPVILDPDENLTACSNAAVFINDITIPDNSTLKVNQSFVKTWRVRNNGTCTWNNTYALSFSGGHPLGSPQIIPLGIDVSPGETVDLSVRLVAPDTPGKYRGNWQLLSLRNDSFGGRGPLRLWTEITVVNEM